MLNKKFASIRATANVKTEKRSSIASSCLSTSLNQRLSQSQSMEMYGLNCHSQHQQQLQHIQQQNNEILMNLSKDSMRGGGGSSSQYDQRSLLSSSPATPIRMMKSSAHPYVNLMHQQYHNNNNSHQQQQQHLQYQNSNNSSTMSFGSPIILDASNGSHNCNQSWQSLSSNQPSPVLQHFSAAQIYMRPKNLMQQSISSQSSPQLQQQISNNSSPMVSHRKPAPEVPKRMSSSVSTASMKKSNGSLSRSGKFKKISSIYGHALLWVLSY